MINVLILPFGVVALGRESSNVCHSVVGIKQSHSAIGKCSFPKAAATQHHLDSRTVLIRVSLDLPSRRADTLLVQDGDNVANLKLEHLSGLGRVESVKAQGAGHSLELLRLGLVQDGCQLFKGWPLGRFMSPALKHD